MKITKIKTPFCNGEIWDNDDVKIVRSDIFNMNFDKKTGYTETWGRTKEQNAEFSPFGPVIADIEVTKKCFGPGGKLCSSTCYKKANPNEAPGMTLDEFKVILAKLPPILTQIAFGADASGTANPELRAIMEYTRAQGIAPNITVADLSDETADWISPLVGAIAVSLHHSHDICYDTIQKLVNRGVSQVNAHVVLEQSSLDNTVRMIKDFHTDKRLKGLNAIVFLSLKQKGRGLKSQQLTDTQYKEVIDLCFSLDVPLGFDSCGSARFFDYSKKYRPDHDALVQMIEPCESSRESAYIDQFGRYWPCSFMEDEHPDWVGSAPNLLDPNVDFMRDVWYSDRSVKFRNRGKKCVECGRGCQLYDIEGYGSMEDFWKSQDDNS